MCDKSHMSHMLSHAIGAPREHRRQKNVSCQSGRSLLASPLISLCVMMDVGVSVAWHWPNRLYIIRDCTASTNDRLTVALPTGGEEYDDHRRRREAFEGWRRITGSELNNSRMDGKAKRERAASTIQNSEIVMVLIQNPAILQRRDNDDDDDYDEVILLALRNASACESRDEDADRGC